MTERMDDLDLERQLAGLAAAVEWPATPDVTAAVRARLATGTPKRSNWLAGRRLSRALVLALLVLVLAVAVAAAIAFGLPGLRITVTSDPLPTPNVPVATATGTTPASRPAGSPPPGAGLLLGDAVSLEEAERRLGLPLLLPSVPGRRGPDAAYVALVQGSPVITLAWGAGVDLPPLRPDSDVGLLVTVLRATVDEALLQKLVRGGTIVEPITVGAARGFWISGGEHILWFRRADGEVITTPIRLVGDTLALELDGRVIRIEVAGGRSVAVALAESIVRR